MRVELWFFYDSLGRQETVTLPDSGEVHTTYWPTGEVKRQWGSRQYPVEYAYAKGRMVGLTTWQDFAGDDGRAVTTWYYDAQRGWLTSKEYADEKGPSYTYYPSGKLDTRTWARGIVTTYTYTNAGELAGVDYSDATPDIGYVYDRVGRKKEVTDAVGTHTWTYTEEGLTDIEAHTAGPLTGWSVDHDYDALLRRSDVKVKEGTTQRALTHTTYDDAGRYRTVGDGTHTATYDYLTNSGHVQHITFNNGTADVMRTTKQFDLLDRLALIGHQRLIGDQATVSSYAYTYNTANQRVRVTEVDGSYWVYGYDALGQVTGGVKYASDDTALPGHAFGYGYDDIGNRQTATTNGRTEVYTANELNQYEQRTVPGAADVLGSASTQAAVFVNQQPATRKGALWHAEVEADNGEAPAAPAVRVDAILAGAGPNGEDIASTEEGHLFVPKTPEVFTYDDDGNLTADGRWIYTWNGENRLVQMETDPNVAAVIPDGALKRQKFTFAYDHVGRRTLKTVYTWDPNTENWTLNTALRFLYDGWNLLAELEPEDYEVDPASFQFQVSRSYTWGLDLSGSLQGAGGIGGLLFTTLSGPNFQSPISTFPTYDGNGNVMQYVSAADATPTAAYTYSPFGQTLTATGEAEAHPYRFSTKYTDETGLVDYGYRYYAPEMGRWLNRDPIEEKGGFALYALLANDGVGRSDPLGLEEWAGKYFEFWEHLHSYVTKEYKEGEEVPMSESLAASIRDWEFVNDFEELTTSNITASLSRALLAF